MKKKRIMCVDDDHDTCELISAILKNYEIKSASSMAEALLLAAKEQFNLYLLDYHLPDGNGMELCLLIKNFDTKTPMLFVTGTSSMVEKQALTIGAQGLIRKNSNSFVEDLEKKVSELMED
jgi:CheY-like chemotaxis protein